MGLGLLSALGFGLVLDLFGHPALMGAQHAYGGLFLEQTIDQVSYTYSATGYMHGHTYIITMRIAMQTATAYSVNVYVRCSGL